MYKQASCTPRMHYSGATDGKTEPVGGHNEVKTEPLMSLKSQLNTRAHTHAADEDLASCDTVL